MAEGSSANWSDDPCSLKEAVKMKRLPCIVKPWTNDSVENEGSRLPKGSTLYVQGKIMINLALVKVEELLSKRDAQHEYGMETVMQHDNCLGEKFYLPLGIQCPLTLCTIPDGRNVFTSVSQVAEDMPTTIRLDEEIMIIGSGPPRVLEKDAVLTVVRSQQVSGRPCLLCRDREGRDIVLKTDIRAKMSVVPDNTQHTLKALVDSIALPKSVQFFKYSLDDMVHETKGECSELNLRLIGALKVMKVKIAEFYVAWVQRSRDKQGNTTFCNVLIPQELWEREKVAVKHFITKDAFDRYVARNFPVCKDYQYVHRSLYFLPHCNTGEESVTILRHPTSQRSATASDSEDSDADYITPTPEEYAPPPSIPPRQPRRPRFYHGSSAGRQPLHQISKSSGSAEQETRPTDTGAQPASKTQVIMQKLKKTFTKQHQKSQSAAVGSTTRHPSESSMSSEPPSPVDLLEQAPPVPSEPNKDYEIPTDDYLEPIEKRKPPPPFPDYREQQSLKREYQMSQKQTVYFRENEESKVISHDRPPIPIPLRDTEGTTSGLEQGDGNQGEPDDRPLYSYADSQELANDLVARQGQTKEDFSRYSVKDVVMCMNMCGMNKVAELCENQHLDGKLLVTLGNAEWTSEPFNLNRLGLTKINNIINKGWRPKL